MLVLLPDVAVAEGAAKEEEDGAAVVGENDEEVGVAEEEVLQGGGGEVSGTAFPAQSSAISQRPSQSTVAPNKQEK